MFRQMRSRNGQYIAFLAITQMQGAEQLKGEYGFIPGYPFNHAIQQQRPIERAIKDQHFYLCWSDLFRTRAELDNNFAATIARTVPNEGEGTPRHDTKQQHNDLRKRHRNTLGERHQLNNHAVKPHNTGSRANDATDKG